MVLQKTGVADETHDADFDDLNRRYQQTREMTARLAEDTKRYQDAIKGWIQHQVDSLRAWKRVLDPRGEEERTMNSAKREYISEIEELIRLWGEAKNKIFRLMETCLGEGSLSQLIINELMAMQRLMDAKITKRAHKLLDYDRHCHSFAKKGETSDRNSDAPRLRTLSDEHRALKKEQAQQEAKDTYDALNDQLKEILPQFLTIHKQLMEPLIIGLAGLGMGIQKVQGWVMSEMEKTTKGLVKEAPADYSGVIRIFDKQGAELDIIGEMPIIQAMLGKIPKNINREGVMEKEKVCRFGMEEDEGCSDRMKEDKIHIEKTRSFSNNKSATLTSQIKTTSISTRSSNITSPSEVPIAPINETPMTKERGLICKTNKIENGSFEKDTINQTSASIEPKLSTITKKTPTTFKESRIAVEPEYRVDGDVKISIKNQKPIQPTGISIKQNIPQQALLAKSYSTDTAITNTNTTATTIVNNTTTTTIANTTTTIKTGRGSKVAELAARLEGIQIQNPPGAGNLKVESKTTKSWTSSAVSSTTKPLAIALYDFQAQEPGDLSFIAGDHIEIVKRTDEQDDWWVGRLVGGKEGTFPGTYVSLL